jgi:MFS family permease
MFFMVIGPAIGYSVVGALTEQIKSTYGVSDSQVSLLFSVYSLPNIVAVFFGGVALDKFGVDKCMAFFAFLFVVGNVIPVIGQNYMSMLVGRVLYGIGNESMNLIQFEVIVRWFEHDPFFSFGLSNAIGLVAYRVSGFLAMFVIPIFGAISLQ